MRKAHARKATGAKKRKTTLSAKSKAKAKASPKKHTLAKMATKSKSTRKPAAKPRSRATMESPMESSRETSRGEMDSLAEQPKMRLSRKNSGAFREKQRSQSQPNTPNPSGRR